LTQRDEEVPVAGSAGREQEALAREVLVGIEVQVEDKSGSRHLQHVARQQRHAVGGSGGRGAITRNLDGVACGEPADNGSRKNVQVEVLRKADLQRAAADERKRPPAAASSNSANVPPLMVPPTTAPPSKSASAPIPAVVLMALPFTNSTVLPLATV
jgi:hypothetical protein